LPTGAPGPSGLLGAAGFHRHLVNPRIEAFITSLSVIEKVIGEKVDPEDINEEEIKKTLPRQYHYLIDVFSKRDSDT
jgi:hypothetical protein